MRLISDAVDFNSSKRTEWVLGISYLDVEEVNFKNDDGVYGDPSDPFGPYASNSSSSSNFSSDNLSIFGSLDYFLDEFTKFSIGARWEDYESNYYDSFGEAFNPADQMSGGKISLNKNLTDAANIFMASPALALFK